MSIPSATTSFLRSIINHDAMNKTQRLAPAIMKMRKNCGTLVMQIDSDTIELAKNFADTLLRCMKTQRDHTTDLLCIFKWQIRFFR